MAIEINPELSEEYFPGPRATGQRFEHVYLGVVDFSTISVSMADKLVKTGHLVKIQRSEIIRPAKRKRKIKID